MLNRELGPDFGLSLEQQQNIAQHNIDRILAQSTSKLTSPPPSSTTPTTPYFPEPNDALIKIEPGLAPSGTYPLLASLPYTSSNTRPRLASQNTMHAKKSSKAEPTSPPPKRQRTGFRPTPKCRLCHTEGKICDGNLRCQTCWKRRAAYCKYDDCMYGDACLHQDCTRLHPEQKAFQNRPYSV